MSCRSWRAARLVGYFKSHARKVYAAMDADPDAADARRVLDRLAKPHAKFSTGPFTRRDLYQHLRGHFQRPDGLDLALQLLVEHRYLLLVGDAPPQRSGPRPTYYRLNPLWDHAGHSTNYTSYTDSVPDQGNSCNSGNLCNGQKEDGDGHSDTYEPPQDRLSRPHS